ncbi:hypothetical protein E2C01_028960 [Portunus trituberculatus]|uniref:Uncharacterized protein n=1 Tax=Portunus trituberculatus TaxID=210409 RepID=A0A5B7EQ64_PORTR|nr:hypothetical protein [Portunus trituberculatus]
MTLPLLIIALHLLHPTRRIPQPLRLSLSLSCTHEYNDSRQKILPGSLARIAALLLLLLLLLVLLVLLLLLLLLPPRPLLVSYLLCYLNHWLCSHTVPTITVSSSSSSSSSITSS